LFSLVAFLIWENEKKKEKEKETKRKKKKNREESKNSLMRSELILSLSQTSLDLFYYYE